MSPNEIDAIRKEIAKLRADLRKKRRCAPILATTERLRAEISSQRQAVRVLEMAGATEGLV